VETLVTASSNISVDEPTYPRFGPYELVRRLGVGGMAETYEAIRRGPGDFVQRVCLKLVQPFYRDKKDFIALFEREARLAGQLRHSNIVGVIDYGRIDGVPYMALELVDGIDLAALLELQPGRRLAYEHVALIGYQLAQALEHAHDPNRVDGLRSAKAIVHRDLSPSNIMVSKRGEVLLTDFGVAKAVSETAHQQSAVKGKVPYMSPEQLRAEPLDGRADIFSLGVVLFEAIAGERPFQGEHDPSTIMRILRGDRASIKAVVPGTPDELAELVERLLETDREKRPQSAAAVVEWLDPFLPTSQGRRELGAMASEAREGRLASLTTPIPSDPSGTSGIGLTTGGASKNTTSTQPTRSSRPIGLVALAVLAVVALWAAFGRMGGVEEDAKSSVAPNANASVPTATTPSASTKPTVDAAAIEPAPSEAPPTSPNAVPEEPVPVAKAKQPEVTPAQLQVTVYPWGDVWINGKRRGAAPLERVLLKPGRYRVSAGQGSPSATKRVVLREGERKTVQFDLMQ
jgi:serine/threonine protein kinase